ncbi:MAG: HIT family protein [Piscinibacter sp.]
MDSACPFCALTHERILDQNARIVAIRDAFPVTLGHTLLIPIRHVGSLFELDSEEQDDLLQLLRRARAQLVAEMGPVADPRGGVRWVVPEDVRYWK